MMQGLFYVLLLVVCIMIMMTLGPWTAIVFAVGVLAGKKVDDTAAWLNQRTRPLSNRFNSRKDNG